MSHAEQWVAVLVLVTGMYFSAKIVEERLDKIIRLLEGKTK